jgi:aspartate/methionine/tyrosine aminotransferase
MNKTDALANTIARAEKAETERDALREACLLAQEQLNQKKGRYPMTPTNSAMHIFPHVACNRVADEIELVERWWRTLPERGPVTATDMDILRMLLTTLRARANDAAQQVCEYEQRTPAVVCVPVEEP